LTEAGHEQSENDREKIILLPELCLGKQGPGRDEEGGVEKDEDPVTILEEEISYRDHREKITRTEETKIQISINQQKTNNNQISNYNIVTK